ncbi:MAG: glycosyltransferase [Deltaproteobacteria bacterium]|nr:glycosyltransferase [Deltaproteobacteria bacterium]
MLGVVHVITRLDLGGAQENTLDSASRMDPERFRTALIYGPGGMLDEDARRLRHVHQEVLPSLLRELSPKDFAGLLALRNAIGRAKRALRARGAERILVHTHGSKAGVLGRAAAHALGVDWIVHTIHGFGFHAGQPRAVFEAYVAAERAAARVTDVFVSVSRASLAEAIARGIVTDAHRRTVIRSGFDLGPFLRAASERVAARQDLLVPQDAEIFASVANLKSQKDPLTLVDAFAEVASSNPRAMLLFAGDGELRAQVERRIRGHELGGRFRLLGWRRDVAKVFAAADVIVLSSIFEGLPRSAVQAIAARRPVVATRVDGTPEVVREGKNGFLVEPSDSRALAKAMQRAIVERPVDPEDARRVQAFDVRVMVERLEGLYEALDGRCNFPVEAS